MDDRGAACLVLRHLPESLFCGIDLYSFTLNPRFRGLKHIPPGWHFLFAAANETLSLRQGVWFHVAQCDCNHPSEMIAKTWDAVAEKFVVETAEPDLASSKHLISYRQITPNLVESENLSNWILLTDCITDSLLSQIVGGPDPKNHWNLSTASSSKEDDDIIPGLNLDNFEKPDRELRLLPIDLKKTWRIGAVGRERTEAARDRSWALRSIVQNNCNGDYNRIIGELQFTYLMTLLLNNNSCMEQWRRILGLVLTCKADVLLSELFFAKFLSTLQLQLKFCEYAEGGLFDMEDTEGNLLRDLLQKFRTGIEDLDELPRQTVMQRLEDLESYLQRQFGWHLNEFVVKRGQIQLEDGEHVEMEMDNVDEEDESGEYAPIVIELTEEQARAMPIVDTSSPSLPFRSMYQ